MNNLWMMFYGLAHLAQGLALILSLGFWNPHLAQRASLAFARWTMPNPRQTLAHDAPASGAKAEPKSKSVNYEVK